MEKGQQVSVEALSEQIGNLIWQRGADSLEIKAVKQTLLKILADEGT